MSNNLSLEELANEQEWRILNSHQEKPQIGLIPRKLHDEERIADIATAIIRYIAKSKDIPLEWLDELYDLAEKQRDKIGDGNE